MADSGLQPGRRSGCLFWRRVSFGDSVGSHDDDFPVRGKLYGILPYKSVRLTATHQPVILHANSNHSHLIE